MKLSKFTLGQIISVGIAATAFLFVASWAGRKTNWPVLKQIAERF